ncbi:OmpA family protein [Salmonirosea aquatica]|uniref:OmpA family protein n=1 Tax=Salmonirosea aquatica TaxID=2654236 RepID=A0A7C9FAN3_9BACT|nr:OmpA family protein [Cytophagaceae bacterium SJW1-29]
MDRVPFCLVFCLFLLVFSSVESRGQKVFVYDFSDGLASSSDSAPALKPLGQEGQYIEEVLPELGKTKRTVYQFEANSGLQFDNNQAYGFLNGSFTIEIYFRLKELESWKRVLDFKNRKSDNGCYIYEGRLNFFNFATGEKAPVKPNEYVHYVFSREAETHLIKMYVDGESKVEFQDPGDEAVLDNDQVLNFFQDDLIAKNEASPGAVALIRMYDRVMTPVFVRESFRQLARTIDAPSTPVPKAEPAPKPESANLEQIVVVAKAPPQTVEVTGKVFNGRTLDIPVHVDVLVNRINSDSVIARMKAVEGTYRFQLPPAHTYRITALSPGFEPKSIVVTPGANQGEEKTLINMSEESYDKPIATLPFSQSDSSLTDAARTALDTLTGFLESRPDLRIKLYGHTDNVGDFDKNLALSRQRAAIARAYLVQKGVAISRIEERGYGPSRPLASNSSESTRQLNRRVEVWAEPIKR